MEWLGDHVPAGDEGISLLATIFAGNEAEMDKCLTDVDAQAFLDRVDGVRYTISRPKYRWIDSH